MFELTEHGSSFSLTAIVLNAGTDLVLLVTGGDRHHVGSVSLAYSQDGSSPFVSSLSAPQHRDSEIGDLFAKELTQLTGQNVAVVCGIHIDNASKSDIDEVRAVAVRLLEKCKKSLKDSGIAV